MITIKFSKEIYPASVIYKTVKAFESLAEIRITEESLCFSVSFENCIYNEQRTVREFGNYAIDLMNNPENGNN